MQHNCTEPGAFYYGNRIPIPVILVRLLLSVTESSQRGVFSGYLRLGDEPPVPFLLKVESQAFGTTHLPYSRLVKC